MKFNSKFEFYTSPRYGIQFQVHVLRESKVWNSIPTLSFTRVQGMEFNSKFEFYTSTRYGIQFQV